MTPYFLIPGITCILEWGWNHYNPLSLVNLNNIGELQRLFNNPYPLYTENIIKSRGNYDVIFGIVTNFHWEVDGNKFRCMTEITSKDRIYAGLIVEASGQDEDATDPAKNTGTKPFDSLVQFIDSKIDMFRNVVDKTPDEIRAIPEISSFVKYVYDTHEKDGNTKEYLYGVFIGRNGFSNNKFQDGATGEDFDVKAPNKELWLNMGLIIDVINFHSAAAKGMAGAEMFHVDIDDVLVGAHPNMISSNGGICLIPNYHSPKYFYGTYGPKQPAASPPPPAPVPPSPPLPPVPPPVPAYFPELKQSDYHEPTPKTEADARSQKKLADFRLQDICKQGQIAYRDDIDQLINFVRYDKGVAAGSCSFPNKNPVKASTQAGNKDYPADFSGYLKHIYINVAYLKDLLGSSSDIKTYFQFVEKLLEGINGACGGVWDLRLVSGTGDATLKPTDPAPMKIVDYKFMSFSNRGKVWSFDYFDADSLLLGIEFKPTLSNAQAIRTIYAPTNNPNQTVITNGPTELLDYHFEDRLHLGKNLPDTPTPDADRSGFEETMHNLQQVSPIDGVYQMTTTGTVRRLVLLATDVQSLLLDDGDEDNNPKYTGIMPGIQAQFTIQGIGGLRTFMMFLVRNLPEPYSEKNIVFRIVDVQETVEAGKWITQITAGVIPLRGFIKSRLGITP